MSLRLRMTPVADRSIGIGVIGMGWMGQVPSRCHRAVSDRFRDDGIKARLVHCADDLETRARRGREQFGFERVSTDWRAIIDDTDVEAIAVAQVSAAVTRSWESGAWEDVGEITG